MIIEDIDYRLRAKNNGFETELVSDGYVEGIKDEIFRGEVKIIPRADLEDYIKNLQ